MIRAGPLQAAPPLFVQSKCYIKQQSVWGTTPTRTVSDVSQLGKVVATHQFTRGDIQSLLSTVDPITEAFQNRYTLNPCYTRIIVCLTGIYCLIGNQNNLI
jgi:hypothetical protein